MRALTISSSIRRRSVSTSSRCGSALSKSFSTVERILCHSSAQLTLALVLVLHEQAPQNLGVALGLLRPPLVALLRARVEAGALAQPPLHPARQGRVLQQRADGGPEGGLDYVILLDEERL